MRYRRIALPLLLLLAAADPCVAIERPKYSVEISEKPFEMSVAVAPNGQGLAPMEGTSGKL